MPRMSKSKKLEWSFFLKHGVQHALPLLCPRLQAEFPDGLSLFAHIISPRGRKRVAHLRTPLADLTERRHSSRITPDQRGCDDNSISN